MLVRDIPYLDEPNERKKRIIEIAVDFFAQKGFAAVTMRDIAKAAGINIASFYYYFESKDVLLEDIVAHFTQMYRHYFASLAELNEQAETLDELMDYMFNDEFVEQLNPMSYLSMSLILKEQHNNELARSCVSDLLYNQSIAWLKADFDRLIEKGVIPPSDTNTISTFLMFSVLCCNEIRVHEHFGLIPPFDRKEMLISLKRHITLALTHGI